MMILKRLYIYKRFFYVHSWKSYKNEKKSYNRDIIVISELCNVIIAN